MKQSLLLPIVLFYIGVLAQTPSRIIEYKKSFTTYPFSDPNQIPDPTAAIYPYNHFDGYTNTPLKKEWKVVELENDYIKVIVLPEIGGKIWAATEKKTGKDFFYHNHVVKFRDVAMRGPWTSGGIESNFGTIGHTPNCSTPVDYTIIKKPDGSVSCIVGALDLLTRTNWSIDINLPSDKAYFTTTANWFNASGLEQPYYHWMNAAIKVSGNLQYVYPGTSFIGHEGEVGDWPINKKNGKDISWYENNNFGGYKSYHVFGKYSNFFGGYWHNDNYGVVRYSEHDDKPGKKLWIWGLSRQGMIWENLLSDADGQYTEIQSGRLFNQSAEGSALSPFKHRGFSPYTTDTWTEYWYPVMNIKGFVFANQYTALNAFRENGWLKLFLSPVQKIQETLTVRQNGKVIFSKPLSLAPLEILADSIRINNEAQVSVQLSNGKLDWKENDSSANLERPTSIASDFDQNGMFGLYLQGKNSIYFRRYVIAEEKLNACLEKEPGFVPALADMSMLQYRKMNYAAALNYAKKALSINTYDAAANYYYGLINKKLGNKADAIDGFDIATQSEEYRTPAFTELAKIYFSNADASNEQSIHYAEKAILYNAQNTDAWQLLALAYKLKGDKAKASDALEHIQKYDPLNCFVKFEKWQWDKTDNNKNALLTSVQNEMPDQTFLELAIWYYNIGMNNECIAALQLAPSTAEINYWLAFLNKDNNDGNKYYAQAKASKTFTAFPFRTESAIPLAWFANTKDWQPVFNLGLVQAACGNLKYAIQLLNTCGNQPDDANFYGARAKLNNADSITAEADMKKAISLRNDDWRFIKQLAELYNNQQRYTEALPLLQSYYQKNPSHYIIGMLLSKTFLLNKQYSQAAFVLDKIIVIPYEGATEGRSLYKEAHLMLSIEAMKGKNYKKALAEINSAKQWPERLGVGKPYEEDIDERLENFLLNQCYLKLGDKTKSADALDRIKNNKANAYKINDTLSEWANGNTSILEKTVFSETDSNSRILNEWMKMN